MLKLIVALVIISGAFANPDRSARIVGGQNVQAGQIPSQASLRSWGTTFHFAGGVLISNIWILTAAEYVIGRANDSLSIALGIVSLSATFTNRRSNLITIHNAFNRSTGENNIACVRSSTTIAFTQFVQPTFLVAQLINAGMGATASGWGATQPDKGPNSEILQMVHVTTAACTADPPPPGVPQGRNFPSILCAAAVTAPGGICTSDIGGPLMISTGVIGIASWHASPCAAQPDEFVRISSVRNWIGSVTGV